MNSRITSPHYYLRLRISISILLMAIVLSASAQDVIHLKDQTTIQSKVVEITDEVISYRLIDEPNDSIISILKSDVAMIIYENGTSDVFENNNIVMDENNINDLDPATVIFMIQANLKLEYFDHDKFFGETKKSGFFKYTCPPGKHLLWISFYNKEFLTADLKPGGTYLVNVIYQQGFTRWDGKIQAQPFTKYAKPKHQETFVKRLPKVRWMTNSEEEIAEGNIKLKEFIDEKLIEYETEWKFSEDFNHISPDMAITDPVILNLLHID